MNTILLHKGKMLFFSFLLLIVAALTTTASASVKTQLLSEDFSEGYVPPPGWNSDTYWWGGSYWSNNGAGGYNGSWVIDIYDCNYDYIYSPTIDLSGYDAATDKVTVEFDVYMEYNASDYDTWNSNGEGGAQLQVFPDDGNYNFWNYGPIKDLSFTSDYYTYDNTGSYSQLYDPDPSSGSWRHYKVDLPSQFWFSTFRLVFFGQAYWNCSGGNVAIDNVTVTAIKPQNVTFAPTNLTLGTVPVGSVSGTGCITITNTSPAPVSISSVTTAGPNPADFQIVGEVPTTIPANGTATVCVDFAPTTSGSRTGILVIKNGSDNNPTISIPLTGIGVAPLITLIPVEPHNTPTKMFYLNYTKLGGVTEQTMLVENSGAGTLIVSPTTNITGDFPSEYTISHLPTSGIPAGGIDTIRIKYHPTMEGLHRATLNVLSNGFNGTQIVTFDGIGIIPKIVVTPNPMRFDSTAIGDSVCSQFTIYNPGSDTLVIKNQVISSTEGDFIFSLLSHELASIPPDKSRTIGVCFKPKQNGAREATLTLLTNIPKTFEQVSRDTGTVDIAISGTGVPYGNLALVANGTGHIDSTIIGTQICRTDTIFNSGSADLSITSLTLSGGQASDFTVSGVTVPFVVKAKSWVAITVCATPSARGIRQTSLKATAVTNEKQVTATLPLAVFGQAVCASVSPSGTTLFDGMKIVKNTDSVLCVEVTNCGDVPATYAARVTDGTYYTVTPAASQPVAPGATTSFCIHFAPTLSGELDSKLIISSSHINDMSLDLKGIGACANIQAAGVAVPNVNAGGHGTFTVTINNSGNLDYTLGTPLITQLPDSAYRIIPPVPLTVPANGNVQMTIGYDPSKISTTYAASMGFPNGGPCAESTPKITWTQTTGTAGVAEQVQLNGFSLDQNYPNPASALTSFNFTTPNEASVRVTLNSVSGAMLKTLIEGRVSEGAHLVTFNTSELASGTYVYVLESEGVRLSRLLVLTK